MIIRAEHNGDAPYSVISRELLQENRIPYGPKCLLLLMLSYPDNWNFNANNLSDTMGEPVTTIREWLNILNKFGHFHENMTVKFGGSTVTVDWLVSEKPFGGAK